MDPNAQCPKCNEIIAMTHGGEPKDYLCSKCETECIAYKELETREIEGFHVMETGTYEGANGQTLTWTEADLDKLVQNHEANVAKIDLALTRDGEHGSPRITMPGGAALGYAKKLYRKGKDLFADFGQIPRRIYDLIKAGAFGQRSIEGKKNFRTGDGQEHGRTMTGLLLFGAGQPAVNTLQDLAALYKTASAPEVDFCHKFDSNRTVDGGRKDRDGDVAPTVKLKELTIEGGPQMGEEKNTLSAQELAKLYSAKERLEEFQHKATDSEKRATDAEAKATGLEAELKVYKDRDERHAKESVETFVNKLVKEGKIKPASKDAEIEIMLTMKPEAREDRQKTLETLTSITGEGVPNPEKPSGEEKKEGWGSIKEEAIALQAKTGVSYEDAAKMVMAGKAG